MAEIRKILRTRSGTRMVSLTGCIPEDWEYVEVRILKKTDRQLIVELAPIVVADHAQKTPEKTPK